MLALRTDRPAPPAAANRPGLPAPEIRPDHLPPYPPLLQLHGLDRQAQVSARALKQAMEDLWGYACDVAAAYALFEYCGSPAIAANLQRPSKLIAARACAFSMRNYHKMLSDIAFLAGEITAWETVVDQAFLASLDQRLTAHCAQMLGAEEVPPIRRARQSRTKYKASVPSRMECAIDWPNATFRDGFRDEVYVMSINGEPIAINIDADTVAMLVELTGLCFDAFGKVSSPYP
ncbi:hypothetical protein sos41_20280 [Alphaproteobacteria bacterium SO-S41]|nr:hypothetical protein sos41_20280 [Alphaproteobacteria bacterium SO-S41]